MKIAILSPDLSHSCLGRAYLLAKVLERRYEVEVVGPLFGDDIWQPVIQDTSISYKWTKLNQELSLSWRFKALTTSFIPYSQLNDLARRIDADAVYASKPLVTSFGLGLLKKLREHVPLVLDIDDWEMGFVKGYRLYDSVSAQNLSNRGKPHNPIKRLKSFLSSLQRIYVHDSPLNARLGERFTRYADKITVSNTYLRDKFGGEIIYHGRDTHAFNPNRFDRELLRAKYNIDDNDQIIMFLGSPAPHKGIMDLIQSVALIKNRNVRLFLVGLSYKDVYCISLARVAKQVLRERFTGFEEIPFARVPELLTVADVVVIPQKRDFASIGQLPAKVFDSMAMAKPVVATNVNDLPQILDGCGWIVEPGNPDELATAIAHILSNPEEANVMGQLARERCIEKYSWDAIESQLVDIFEEFN
jgi:glycosyltransferase involved in cell wall biosynthesis